MRKYKVEVRDIEIRTYEVEEESPSAAIREMEYKNEWDAVSVRNEQQINVVEA
jgi:hypothetical protein